MKRHTAPWLLAAFLLPAASAAADEVSDWDRFRLWNGCKPVILSVDVRESIPATKDAIEVAVRSRLRAARLYTESVDEAAWSALSVAVDSAGQATHTFSVRLTYQKQMRDRATGIENFAAAWQTGAIGTVRRIGQSLIMSAISQHTDRFIDEYLRVNDDACK